MAADITLNSGSGGAIIATDPTTSSEHYQLIKLAQGAVGTFTLVTTANAFPVVTNSSFQGGIVSLSSQISVTATAGTNPWSSAPGFNVPVVSVSSGVIQLSSQLTVTATGPVTVTSGLISVTSGTITLSSATSLSSGTVTLSSVPTIFSASSGGVQAFIPISPTSSVAGAGFGPVTSSAGVLASLSSGTVSLSSQITVTATGPVTVTSGLISITSGTITLSSATSLSSGTVTLSSVPTILSASSGLIQALFPVMSSAGFGPVTSSAGVLASLSSGTVSLSSQITVTATGPVTITSGTITLSSVHTVTATAGTNPWSSAPGFNVPVVSVSSGLVQLSSQITVTATGPVTITSGTVTLSSVHTVTATAGTNPWSSAPGFNVPVVTVSSGFVRAFPVGAVTSSGLSAFHRMTTGGAAVAVITTAPSSLYGYAIFNSSAVPRSTKFYNSTAPTIGGSTANLILTVQAPGSTGGGGANLTLPIGLYSSNGWSCIITAGMGDTDTGAPGTNDISCGVFYQT